MEVLEQALEAAHTFTPLSEETVAGLLARTADASATGKYELFKTSIAPPRKRQGIEGRG
jgi:hypothetical protein